MTHSLPKVRRRRSVYGLSLVETLVGATVMVMSLGGMAAATMYLLKGVNRNLTESPLQSSGRAGIDEVLYQLRGASNVVASHTFSDGTTITSGNSALVVQAPAYNPSSSSVVLHGSSGTAQYDTIGFKVDSNNRLLEYIDPVSGSYRSSRTAYVVSKNVSNTSIFSPPSTTASSHSVTLSQTVSLTAQGPVTFSYVQYTPVAGSLSSAYTVAGSVPYTGSVPTYTTTNGTTTITVANVPAGNNVTVYVYYTTASSLGASISSSNVGTLSQVNVELDLSSTDARGNTRTVTSNGSAYLHNYGRSL